MISNKRYVIVDFFGNEPCCSTKMYLPICSLIIWSKIMTEIFIAVIKSISIHQDKFEFLVKNLKRNQEVALTDDTAPNTTFWEISNGPKISLAPRILQSFPNGGISYAD